MLRIIKALRELQILPAQGEHPVGKALQNPITKPSPVPARKLPLLPFPPSLSPQPLESLLVFCL